MRVVLRRTTACSRCVSFRELQLTAPGKPFALSGGQGSAASSGAGHHLRRRVCATASARYSCTFENVPHSTVGTAGPLGKLPQRQVLLGVGARYVVLYVVGCLAPGSAVPSNAVPSLGGPSFDPRTGRADGARAAAARLRAVGRGPVTPRPRRLDDPKSEAELAELAQRAELMSARADALLGLAGVAAQPWLATLATATGALETHQEVVAYRERYASTDARRRPRAATQVMVLVRTLVLWGGGSNRNVATEQPHTTAIHSMAGPASGMA